MVVCLISSPNCKYCDQVNKENEKLAKENKDVIFLKINKNNFPDFFLSFDDVKKKKCTLSFFLFQSKLILKYHGSVSYQDHFYKALNQIKCEEEINDFKFLL